MPRCKACGSWTGGPRNAFRPWTPRLDEMLIVRAQELRRMGHSADSAIAIMAVSFGRSINAIEQRLARLDLIVC